MAYLLLHQVLTMLVVFARSVKDVALVTNTIKGYDIHDMTTYQDDSDLLEGIDEPLAGKRLFYIKRNSR